MKFFEKAECGVCQKVVPMSEVTEVGGFFICPECIESKFDECHECGELFLKENMTETIDGDLYCEDCTYTTLITCDECGGWMTAKDDVGDDCHTLCEDCFETWYYRCNDCGDIVHADDVVFIDGDSYCDYCADHNFQKCDHCCEYIHPDRVVSDDDTTICEDCYEDSYYRCDECGAIIHHIDAHLHRGDFYCSYCIPNDIIKEYDWKPDSFNYFGNSLVKMGIELEIDGAGEDEDNAQELIDIAGEDKLYCKHDGSLKDGFELVSHPCDLEYHLNEFPWEEIIYKAKRLGYESHDKGTCGLHIHIARKGLGHTHSEQDNTIMKMLYLFEKHWDKILRFSRRTARQADEWARRYCEYDHEQDKMEDMEWLSQHAKDDCSKYRAINLLHSNTIEIRIFRGTLRYCTFVATLQFCQLLVDICTSKSAREVMEMTWSDIKRYGADYEEFMEYCDRRGI